MALQVYIYGLPRQAGQSEIGYLIKTERNSTFRSSCPDIGSLVMELNALRVLTTNPTYEPPPGLPGAFVLDSRLINDIERIRTRQRSAA